MWYAVPVMPEGVCPYEVSANWACLDGDFASTTVLAKDGKPLGIMALVLNMYNLCVYYFSTVLTASDASFVSDDIKHS